MINIQIYPAVVSSYKGVNRGKILKRKGKSCI